jgi:YegS/Rv2252/BmrU family lipid kinase
LFKKIHFIINPAAGTDEPVLSYINRAFTNTDVEWNVTVTHGEGEVFAAAKRQVGKTDLLAVYGGDGSMMEAAQALHHSKTPMAVLPGGTANIMAKELLLPLDTEEAIRLLLTDNVEIKKIDMGLVNGCPFLLRVNLGILADMITETTSDMKEAWGQWAYGITAFKNMQREATMFHLTIDGKEYEQEAVALTVTNAGNVGKKGYDFLPGISISDGWLDVIALDKADFMSILKVTGSVLFKTDSDIMKHWKAKEIIVRMNEENPFLRDDILQKEKKLHIKISPQSLSVIVPKT